jgi:hypothetical protein
MSQTSLLPHHEAYLVKTGISPEVPARSKQREQSTIVRHPVFADRDEQNSL